MAILNGGLGFSHYVNGRAKVLGGIYAAAYTELIRTMRDNSATLWQRDRSTVMLARVDAIVRSLDAETKKFVEAQVPAVYFATARETKAQARKLGMAIPESFGQLHTEATKALADDAMLRFGRTLSGVKTSVNDIVRMAQQDAIRQQIAVGQITGKSAEELAKTVRKTIEEQGITALVDKSGKKWQLDTYAEMLTRQMLANSGRDGVRNTAQEYGLDLVQISDHNSDHEECAAWEGEIVSLSGDTDGYPTLEEATAAGLFHVGCRHGYTILPNRKAQGL